MSLALSESGVALIVSMNSDIMYRGINRATEKALLGFTTI